MLNREHVSDSLRFWELGRIPYNLVLAAMTVSVLGAKLWAPLTSFEGMAPLRPILIIFAVGANIAYCAAYPVDLFVQASNYRDGWRRGRWMLWTVGTLLAASFTWLVLLGLNAPIID
ncbi:MAG: hypothetical protein ABUS57_09500 [Pseudomonadota bacterium]